MVLLAVSASWGQPRDCVGCHNGAARAGGLELGADSGPAILEKVVRRRVRSMRPAGMPRTDDAVTVDALLKVMRAAHVTPEPEIAR